MDTIDMVSLLGLAVISTLMGITYVRFLTVHPLRMGWYMFFTTLFLAVDIILIAVQFNGWEIAGASVLAFVGFMAGYIWMTKRLLAREDPRPIPPLTRKKDDPGLGHTAVIYFTHGEPETYDPIGWINQFNEFDEQKIPFVPLVARPFFIYSLRRSYLSVGRSEHRRTHLRMVKALENEIRKGGDTKTRFYISFLDDNPRPDAAFIHALNEGASRIVVAEIFVSDSNHTLEGKHLIEEVGAHDLGVPVIYTGPMYDSEIMHSMFVERVHAHMNGTDKSKVGVLLVGHGQPDEWDREFATETEHELLFRNKILDRFEEAGFARENLSLAWMEFKEPKPAPKIEEFTANGVEKIFYFSAAISADALHSQWDVPHLISKARNPRNIPIINLGAWNDDPIAIQAIKEKVSYAMER
ncbi:MAG: ferrochelatase [Anaerolineales bacterium]|nr:ferrochelatase [Anaerolineales bacterium]